MLAFYDATHLRMRGEDILDEALEFTTTHLKSTASLIGNLLAEQSFAEAFNIRFQSSAVIAQRGT